MNVERRRRLATVLFVVVLTEVAVSGVFEILAARAGHGTASPGEIMFLATFMLFPIVGVVLARRRPENALGWLLLAIGIVAFPVTDGYASYALNEGLPGGAWAASATSWTWVPTIGLAGTFLLLLFPNGHLPSERWRWFAWAIAIGMTVSSVAILLGPGTLADLGYPDVPNPFGVEALRPFMAVAIAAIVTIPIGVLGSAFSLVVRYRRADRTERLQIRWLASAAAVVAVVYAITMAVSLSFQGAWAEGQGWIPVLQSASITLFALLPISIGIAVLKYRLYEIDVVIRKTVVVGAIAAFFTAVYIAVVGGVGALVQTRSAVLSFVAAAIVAALFQPVLRSARRFADRIVYGKRATPYEVLSEFSDRVSETYAADDVLERMARVVGEAIAAARADIWLRTGHRLRVAASWPGGVDRPADVAFEGGELPSLPSGDAAFAVEHQGDVLGALAVAMPANDPLDEARSKLVSDLAGQAGLVLRNVRLTEDLRARLEDLKAAQKRLVTAQDAERRRLERDIHDGAQQQLVALSVRLRLARSLVEKDPATAQTMLAELQEQATETLEDLRDLARGIYPPLLADKGLPAALEAQIRKGALAVELAPDGVGRYPQDVEAAVYFSVLEALQNVAKYANAAHVEVRLGASDAYLGFEVRDDGVGFDASATGYGTGLQGMADRLAALEGSLVVDSAPGRGTVVRGRVRAAPVPEEVRGG